MRRCIAVHSWESELTLVTRHIFGGLCPVTVQCSGGTILIVDVCNIFYTLHNKLAVNYDLKKLVLV